MMNDWIRAIGEFQQVLGELATVIKNDNHYGVPNNPEIIRDMVESIEPDMRNLALEILAHADFLKCIYTGTPTLYDWLGFTADYLGEDEDSLLNDLDMGS